MKLFEEFKLFETMWDNKSSLSESTRSFYNANETVQDYVDDVGPYESGFTLIKNFWLPTNRGKLNVGLISLDSTDGEDGLVCIPSYDAQFVAPMNEAEDVYEMLYNAEAFDDMDAFIDKFIGCSSAKSVKKLLDSNIGHLAESSVKELDKTTGSDVTGYIIKLGCATIDFNQAKTTDQIYTILEQAFDQYSEDWDTQISYGEFCTKFVPALKANPNVPAVVKKLFATATDIHNIVFNDCDDDILTVCYKALEYAGLDTDSCGVDTIAEFISNYAVAYLNIEEDKLYIQLSNPDSVELGNDFIEYMS